MILTSRPANGGTIPSMRSNPSTNNARHVKSENHTDDSASLLCLRIDSSSIRLASSNVSLSNFSTSSLV